MNSEELKEHRKYITAYVKHRRANFSAEQKELANEQSRKRQAKPENRARSAAYHKKQKQLHPEIHQRYVQKGIDNLDKNYVKSILYKQLGLRFDQIPDQLVELKRAQLKLRRMVNE